jgi:hypothetical protein
MLSQNYSINRTGLFAITAVNTAKKVDLISLGITFALGHRIIRIVLC